MTAIQAAIANPNLSDTDKLILQTTLRSEQLALLCTDELRVDQVLPRDARNAAGDERLHSFAHRHFARERVVERHVRGTLHLHQRGADLPRRQNLHER